MYSLTQQGFFRNTPISTSQRQSIVDLGAFGYPGLSFRQPALDEAPSLHPSIRLELNPGKLDRKGDPLECMGAECHSDVRALLLGPVFVMGN